MTIPFEKSFASHEKSKHWSKTNKKQPSDVSKFSHSKYLFDCNLCGHEFEKIIADITKSNTWCGFCANRKLCDNNDCETCYKKSFDHHEKSIFWSKNNVKQPREVFKSTGSKYLFDCEKCGHEFKCQLNCITNMNNWCNFCANKKLCDKDCKICFDKSFDSHEKKIYWRSKNEILPREVFKSTRNKYIFYCEFGHEFESVLYSIINGRWCPKCQNKTETKLYEKMIPLFPSIIMQFKQEWCKNIRCLPFDFCIPEPKIIIELDGRQHFIQVGKWESPEISFENDKYKENHANKNGYSTIRIIQEDVWNDKYDWYKELCEAIEIIKNGNKVVNIYLCKKGEYDNFNPK